MARIGKLLCLVILAVFTIVTADDYCNMKSCSEDHSHTMCQYPSSEPASACGSSPRSGLSDDDKKTIVDEHNRLRQYVASGQESRGNPGAQYAAVEMKQMDWDDELAEIAQRWANQCVFQHDKCRNVDRYVVGQNIAITYNSGENNTPMKDFVQMWYDEVKDFDKNGVDSYTFDSNTGHYTQVVWNNSTKIGCGSMNYHDDSDGWNKKTLVCNYGPSGNWQGQKIYEKKSN
ncbi:venom allergen 3 [Solenopsis invicta]|uniref:venom allergen 3 n=1 Tax=Solenopsis invicta TaxID=13686 RepID=UPI00193E9E13|nr:venom allergen 3 [Solenopsis invicta]